MIILANLALLNFGRCDIRVTGVVLDQPKKGLNVYLNHQLDPHSLHPHQLDPHYLQSECFIDIICINYKRNATSLIATCPEVTVAAKSQFV